MSDIFDKIAKDFKSRSADRTVQVNTGYVQGLDHYGPGNYTDIIDDLDDGFYQEFDGFEREAHDRKARLPSHKHNDKDVVEKAWRKHKENHPSMAENEGAMTSEGIDPEKVKENRKKLDADKDEDSISKSALGRLAYEGFHTAEDIDAHDLDKTSGEGGRGSYMSVQNLNEMVEALQVVCDKVEYGEELEDWVEDKISHAHATITDLARFFGYGDGRFTFDGYRKSSADASILRSLFSVGGEPAETGSEILEINGHDEDVRDALEVALSQGSFKGYHMEDIVLVKRVR